MPPKASSGPDAVKKKRLAFPIKVGEHVTLRTDLKIRSAYWMGEEKDRPFSKFAGAEGRVTSLNVSDEEVYIKGIGWSPVGDLLDPSEISWEDDDEIIDDDDEILEDDDDEILEDDDDDIIFDN